MRKKKFDPLLAEGWPMSKVQLCLPDRSQKNMLVSFVRKRFEERFFGPIRVLRRAADNSQGYGFAMMSLCSLLVESIESFRLGLPSTYRPDMRNLHTYSPPSAKFRRLSGGLDTRFSRSSSRNQNRNGYFPASTARNSVRALGTAFFIKPKRKMVGH